MKTFRRNSVVAFLSIAALFTEARAQQHIDLATTSADMEIVGLSSFKKTGHALAVGDVNGDSRQDLIIGAIGIENTERPKLGRVYVIFGKPSFTSFFDLNFTAADVEIEAIRPNAGLGAAVTAADVNGDGVDDIIFSEPDADASAGGAAGLVSIFWGRTNFPRAIADLDADVEIHGEAALNHFGSAIATGDFNNDTIADIIVGVPQASPPNRPSGGKVYVVYGRSQWPASLDLAATSADFTVLGAAATQFIGNAVSAGDLNNDGRDDLIIGDFKANTAGGVDAGKTFIIFGNDSLRTQIDLANRVADVTISGAEQQDHFGFSLATGDFDGDGSADLMVGARRADDVAIHDVGKVFVFKGTQSWLKEIDLLVDAADFTLIGGPDPGSSGFAIAVGKFNDDGRDDIVVGAPFASPEGRSQSGSSFVFAGRASTAQKVSLGADSSTAIVLGASAGHTLGNAVAAGDLNGDGMDEVIIAAEDAAPAGRIYVLSGDLITAITNEESGSVLPSSFALLQNYPNPFNAGTTIALEAPANAGEVEVAVFNLQGQKIVSLFNGTAAPGRMELRWDGRDAAGKSLSSGVYFYVLKAGASYSIHRKLIFLK